MRNIDSIIVHCSATKAGLDFTATDIDRWHRERGFNGIGYHYVIRLDGKLEKGRDVTLAGAHCKGWNERSVGICYIGGLDENGRPADTRTNVQKRVLYQIIMDLQREYNILQVLGHRDTSPDLNGDGVIEPYEYVKACPCFDVKEFLRSGRELLFVLLGALVVPVLLSGCRSKKEVINRESEVRVDSSLNSSSGKSLVKNKVALEKDLNFKVNVKNTGKCDGAEVIQVYVRKVDDMEGPVKSLRAFRRVPLKAGESCVVSIDLLPATFEFFDPVTNTMRVMPGKYEVMYGNSSDIASENKLSVILR